MTELSNFRENQEADSSRKVFQSKGMLPGNKKMRSLNVDENENCKYPGVLEADDIKHSKMKDRGNCACGPIMADVFFVALALLTLI